MKTRQIVWTSASYNEGDDGVFFFNLGKVNTAHRNGVGDGPFLGAKNGSCLPAKRGTILRRQIGPMCGNNNA